MVMEVFLPRVAGMGLVSHIGRDRKQSSGWNQGSVVSNPQDRPPVTHSLHIGSTSSKLEVSGSGGGGTWG